MKAKDYCSAKRGGAESQVQYIVPYRIENGNGNRWEKRNIFVKILTRIVVGL